MRCRRRVPAPPTRCPPRTRPPAPKDARASRRARGTRSAPDLAHQEAGLLPQLPPQRLVDQLTVLDPASRERPERLAARAQPHPDQQDLAPLRTTPVTSRARGAASALAPSPWRRRYGTAPGRLPGPRCPNSPRRPWTPCRRRAGASAPTPSPPPPQGGVEGGRRHGEAGPAACPPAPPPTGRGTRPMRWAGWNRPAGEPRPACFRAAAPPPRRHHRLQPGVRAQLAHRRAQIALHRLRPQPQPLGRRGVRRPGRHAGQHVHLARRQPRAAAWARPAARRRRAAPPGPAGRRRPAVRRAAPGRPCGARARSSPCASRTSSHAAGAPGMRRLPRPGQQLRRLVPDHQGLLHVAGRRHRRRQRPVAERCGARSAPYSTPRTRRRTTTGTASTERSPSAATAASYSWLMCARGAVVRHRARAGTGRPPCRPGRCPTRWRARAAPCVAVPLSSAIRELPRRSDEQPAEGHRQPARRRSRSSAARISAASPGFRLATARPSVAAVTPVRGW